MIEINSEGNIESFILCAGNVHLYVLQTAEKILKTIDGCRAEQFIKITDERGYVWYQRAGAIYTVQELGQRKKRWKR